MGKKRISEIDQSGKVEKTSKNTVLALSNDSWDAVIIKAKTKRQLQEIFRRNGQVRNYVLFTFSAGLAVLIKRNIHVNSIIVDREYFGKEPIIKKIVTEILTREKKLPEIHFGLIGKLSPAHDIAAKITHKKQEAKYEINLGKILRLIKKTEVGKRLKDA